MIKCKSGNSNNQNNKFSGDFSLFVAFLDVKDINSTLKVALSINYYNIPKLVYT